MKSGKPWSLNDIDEDTRKALLKAAEQSGLSVSEWLGHDWEENDLEPEEIDPPDEDKPSISSDYDEDDPGSGRLGEAIARLTERLSGLDDKVRESAGDLKARLADIENRLGAMADSHETGAAREQSLSDIAQAVDDLVRDLDSLDERARSTIEGLGEPARRQAGPIERAADASGGRNSDLAHMDDDNRQTDDDGDHRELDDVRHRLDDLLSESPIPAKEPPPRAANIAAALQSMEARIDEAKTRTAPMHQARPLAKTSSAADQIGRIEARLNDISGRLPAKKDADLAAAIREISVHQRTIDDRVEITAIRDDQKALAADVAALRADIATLAGQVSEMGSNDAAQPADSGFEVRFGELAARVEEVVRRVPDRFRLDALGEEVSALRRAFEANDGAQAVERLEARITEMSAAVQTMVASRDAEAPREADIRRIEQRLEGIAGGLNELIEQGPTAASSPTVAGLEARLTEMTAAINGLIHRPAAESHPDMGALKERLDKMAASIGDRLSASAMSGNAPDIARMESRIDDIADSVKGLYMGTPLGASAGKLEGRLDEIASGIESLRHHDAPVADVAGLRGGLKDLAERIDGLNRPQSDFEADLQEIKTEIGSIRTVHERLQTLTERIDGLSEAQNQPLLAIAEIKDGIGAIKSLYVRMQTLTDRVDRMSAAQRDPVPVLDQMKTGFAAVHQIQERLQKIGESIDKLSAAGETSGLDELKAGIAAVEVTHDQLHTLAERIDAMAAEREPSLVLDEIRDEIAAIRVSMAGHSFPDAERLEGQIQALAERVEKGSVGETQAPAIAALEAQVANITTALAGHKPPTAAIQAIEERLERMQTHLASTRNDSIDAARHEAREAVRELSSAVAGTAVDSDLIGAVVQDLDALRTTAGDSDQRVRSKLESVNQTLAEVLARLGRLEGEPSEPSQATGTYGATYPAQPAAEQSPPMPAAAPPPPAPAAAQPAPAPSAEPSAEAWTDAFQGDDSADTAADASGWDEPQAEQTEEKIADKQAHERRADFIAAARRAVQAAAVEATASINQDDARQHKPGAFSRLSKAIRSRKRTLLVAAAAIVLAVSAVHTYRTLLASEDAAEVIAEAATEDGSDSMPVQEIVAEAVPETTPTVPAVTEPALVAPSFTPDREVAFAEPVFGTRFQPTATGSVGDPPGDGSDEMAEPVLADNAPPIAADEVEPPRAEQSDLDPSIGSHELIAAAKDGNPAAMFEVAARYAEGERVTKNLAEAALWYERAAEGGVAVAQYRIGSLYERGQGVAQDLTKAVNWYQRAADQGNVNSMHNLAALKSAGVDGPPDRTKALQWFQAAAGYGVRDSQYNLGVIYARGLGTEQDLIESYKWFAIAAAQGDTDAAARRDEIGAALNEADLATAQAAIDAWHVKASLAKANGVSEPAGGWDSAEDVIDSADREALVRKIQTLLAEQGFDPGPADGIPGPRTRQAVKEFQRKVGAPATGQIDTNLMAALSDS